MHVIVLAFNFLYKLWPVIFNHKFRTYVTITSGNIPEHRLIHNKEEMAESTKVM